MSITSQDDAGLSGGEPRRRMPRAEREALMLDVAEKIFGELGYQASSMDEIAARAGVSKPMLYHYYGSKERLFLACLRRARDGMRAAILAGVGVGTRPDEQLYLALVGWYRFIDEHPALWTMMLDEGLLEFGPGAEEIESIRSEHTELIAALILSHGPPGRSDMVEVELIAAAISGAGERITRWRSRHPDLTPERTARHLMQLLWVGMSGIAQGAVWEP
ncbi:TetR/AcrR family transcriptional regulator [Sporichthya sp.]|uniref:TetR/AcrR family transcriptional regulator n=1 Tax=Sporichthya sp. TaxID=65475 RepID=UPI0017FA26E3|nr:TetR/AcrR family transcriptional regulator [Sporichthya sp.]MBA3742251.1 TetR/AcrR family transcriptional regulator [Sporichthya sp.]